MSPTSSRFGTAAVHTGNKTMSFSWSPREHWSLGKYILKWLCIVAPVAAAIGTTCALFLWMLDHATQLRYGTPWLLFLLPVAGAGISLLYSRVGRAAEGGNNLLMEAIHGHENGDSGIVVPSRMAPLIILSTVATHLFGGSAGREGTAVQMGGSIASTIGRWFRMSSADTRTLLMAGIAAGFGAVFGTPLTGAVFAMEVLAVGRMSYDALIPCLIAAVIGDWSCGAWGIHHTHYSISGAAAAFSGASLDGLLTVKVAVAAIAFGLVSVMFAELSHGINHIFKRVIARPVLRPVVGGLLVIALVYLLGTRDYLGLGVSSPDPHTVTILSSFSSQGAGAWSWWWKLLFTAVTLGSGFKGGEVTPLFFIGATLGNSLASLMGAPVDLFAGLGFVAVFAGATNTPLACTLMGIELFGSQYTLYFAVACFLSYLCSGHSGIYLSQRIGTPKFDSVLLPPDASLRVARELRPGWSSLAAGLRNIFSFASDKDKLNGGLKMSHNHKLKTNEIGQVRIYMTPGERRRHTGNAFKRLMSGSPPLYKEIIIAAKQDGLLNATAHHTHFGFSGRSQVQANNMEISNPSLNMCVELIAPREQLEQFCRKHGVLLHDKVVVYKQMEHWKIGAHGLQNDEAAGAAPVELNAVIDDEHEQLSAAA